ncbi:Ras-related protein Rab-32 [Tritrichomonas foetus]|uniref:Ras-related protein Rab n=1 Tax=Tritrichomonas foetus TaxID=1144522 RepID=A0A1J4J558_9EUKA|nr:Ras-related protein Rab-32 [Tritrichomonas foetus]|eukprot:OHS94416.1 Ras-related protein Rab-32 [Tritrichomonas foetus]
MDANEGLDESSSQRVLKIIVVGDMGTGKTSMIRKFVEGNFTEFYKITIGVDFANKVVKWNDSTSVDVQLWDIAGQERFGNMTGVYYRESVGAIVVFDVMRNATFDMTKVWKKDIDEKVQTAEGQPVPTILLGNKIDLMTSQENWEKKKAEIEEYTKENNFLAFFETSAKEGTNLDDAIMTLVDYIMKNNIESESSREMNAGVDITDTSRVPKAEGGCC